MVSKSSPEGSAISLVSRRTIQQLQIKKQSLKISLNFGSEHPIAQDHVKTSFYVDDFLAGASTPQEATHLQQQLRVSSSREASTSQSGDLVLLLSWNPEWNPFLHAYTSLHSSKQLRTTVRKLKMFWEFTGIPDKIFSTSQSETSLTKLQPNVPWCPT